MYFSHYEDHNWKLYEHVVSPSAYFVLGFPDCSFILSLSEDNAVIVKEHIPVLKEGLSTFSSNQPNHKVLLLKSQPKESKMGRNKNTNASRVHKPGKTKTHDEKFSRLSNLSKPISKQNSHQSKRQVRCPSHLLKLTYMIVTWLTLMKDFFCKTLD